MSESLPEHLDPWRAAKSGQSFSGRLPLSGLPRVAALVMGSAGDPDPLVSYRLDLGRDESGQVLVTGVIQARLGLVCQRCLGDLLVDVEARPRVALVRTERAATALTSEEEVLVVDDDGIRLLDLIEDELLLAVPIVPRHAAGSCVHPESADLVLADSGVPEQAETEERDPNPFAVLATLKRESDT